MRLSDRGQQLLDQYKDLYNGKEYFQEQQIVNDNNLIFDGFSMYKHLWNKIVETSEEFNGFTLLDYGCGRAKHVYARVLPEKRSFHEFFRGRCQCYYCYDPANPIYMRKPPAVMKFDIIVCADVMEHIAEDDVSEVIKDIASFAHDNSKILFSICGSPAMKSFADDGENFHVTLKDRNWWKAKIAEQFDIKRTILVYHA